MKRPERELRKLLQGFLAERLSLTEFQEAFLARWTRLPAGAMPAPAHALWNQVYAELLRAVSDPAAAGAASEGLVGEAELRARLRAMPGLAGPP